MTKKKTHSEKSESHGDTHERILKTARNLFFNEGFSNVSGDLLCKEASVSKTSIYRHFGDMAGVFSAVVREETKGFAVDGPPQFQSKDQFLAVLSSFGETLLKFLNSKEILQFNRLMYSAAQVDKNMTRRFYDNAYQVAHDLIGVMIENAKEQRLIENDIRSTDLAGYLIAMWEGLPYIKARLSLTDKPFTDPKGRAAECVHILFG